MVFVSSVWGKLNFKGLIFFKDYDALALAPTSNSPMAFDQTRFSVNDEDILKASTELVNGLRMVNSSTEKDTLLNSIFLQ